MAEVLRVPNATLKRIREAAERTESIVAERGRFVLLSWNVDGLDETGATDTMHRILAVAQEVASCQASVVLLQEAIPPQLELLMSPKVLGSHYDVACAEDPAMPYYCAVLWHKKRARLEGAPWTRHFSGSRMGRHLLGLRLVLNGLEQAPVTFFNTHLESTRPERAERQRQMAEALVAMGRAASTESVILGGDLNIRDPEMEAARKAAVAKEPLSGVVHDAWMACGSPAKCEFTWDTAENTNPGVLFKSRCRFDRVLFASPAPAARAAGAPEPPTKRRRPAEPGTAHWRPGAFELVGRTKIEGLGRFPSDHWGLRVTWSLPGQPAAGSGAPSGHARPVFRDLATVSETIDLG